MGESEPLPRTITLIFDGQCGMCTRMIMWILARDHEHRITPVPCQAREGLAGYGITRDQCEASVWAVTSGGERVAGGQAAVLIVALLWRHPWMVSLGRMPGVRQLLDVGYRLVARNRSHVPGITPWCESHPDACVTVDKAW